MLSVFLVLCGQNKALDFYGLRAVSDNDVASHEVCTYPDIESIIVWVSLGCWRLIIIFILLFLAAILSSLFFLP